MMLLILLNRITSILAIGLFCGIDTTIFLIPDRIALSRPISVGSKVSLGMFSGILDPTWSLSKADTNRLLTQIQQLESIPTHKFIEKMGVENWLVRINRSPDSIAIERGFIEYHRQGKSRFCYTSIVDMAKWNSRSPNRQSSPNGRFS